MLKGIPDSASRFVSREEYKETLDNHVDEMKKVCDLEDAMDESRKKLFLEIRHELSHYIGKVYRDGNGTEWKVIDVCEKPTLVMAGFDRLIKHFAVGSTSFDDLTELTPDSEG